MGCDNYSGDFSHRESLPWFGKLTFEAHREKHPEVWWGVTSRRNYKSIESRVREDMVVLALEEGLLPKMVEYVIGKYDSVEGLDEFLTDYARKISGDFRKNNTEMNLYSLSTYSVTDAARGFLSDLCIPDPYADITVTTQFFGEHVRANVTAQYLRKAGAQELSFNLRDRIDF